MNPLRLFQMYFSSIRQNYSLEKLPWNERIYHVVFPLSFSLLFLFIVDKGLSDGSVTLLITVHGILLSVLMASFTPFIEKIDKESVKQGEDQTSEEREFKNSLKIAKKLIFSANSLAIFISIVIVIFLLFAKYANESLKKDFLGAGFRIDLNFCFYLYYFALYLLVLLNAVLIVRTVHLIADIVIARIDEEK